AGRAAARGAVAGPLDRGRHVGARRLAGVPAASEAGAVRDPRRVRGRGAVVTAAEPSDKLAALRTGPDKFVATLTRRQPRLPRSPTGVVSPEAYPSAPPHRRRVPAVRQIRWSKEQLRPNRRRQG